MKKITLITASILVFASVSLAANGFREGNKLYLGGKYKDALDQYQDFINKNPEYYEGYYNAGNALFRQEQYEGALGMYKKAQEINPKDPDIQYNIEVTQKKMEQKKKESENPNQQDKNGQKQQNNDSKKAQQNKQGEQGRQQGQNGQQQESDQQQAKQGEKQETPDSGSRTPESKQPPSGMTADEVQALLNQKQNQEKQLQGYFGKQYQKQNREPDLFNMSPQEIMQYMMQRQMDPNFEPQQGGSKGNEKDW